MKLNRTHLILVPALCAAVLGCGTTGLEAPPFAVARVTLYDCGLSQLERQSQVSGATEFTINTELAHLDDLLATLVVAAEGDVRVSGVKYPSVFTLGQSRAASSFANASGDSETLESEPGSDLCKYVLALVGTPVEVETMSGRKARGAVLDCALDDSDPEAEGAGSEHLVLVSQTGGISWFAMADIKEITPTSAREGEAIANYARQLGRAPGLGETTVQIQIADGSTGKLAAGYIRQAPIWRMSYKLRVNDTGVQLEAWGLVHNDTDEAWDDVGLTLVSGLPESFVMSVASPRYAEREAMYTDGDQDMYPQLGAATPDSLLYDESVIRYSYGGGSGYGIGAGGSSYSMGSASMSGRSVSQSLGARMAQGSAGASSLLKVAGSAIEEQAEPAVEEEISTYRALTPVSVPPRASSMVPLMQKHLPGQAFTLIYPGGGDPHTCVHVRNETGLVLQYGGASFYIDGRFRGQTELARAEPGDIRVLCFGMDPDVTVIATQEVKKEIKALEWRWDSVYAHALQQVYKTYTIDNRAGIDRNMAVEITHRPNGRIVSPEGAIEGEGAERYTVFTVPARTENAHQVHLEEGIEYQIMTNVFSLSALLEEKQLPQSNLVILRKAIAVLKKKEAIDLKIADKNADMAKVTQALERKRTNFQALPPGTANTKAAEHLAKDLLTAEGKFEKLILEKDKLIGQSNKEQDKANKILATLPRPAL